MMPGSAASSGSRHPSSAISLDTLARSDHLCLMSDVENPGVPRGTRKPRIPWSVIAHITATSAIDPFVTHLLWPSSTQSCPTFRARVRSEAGSLPPSGSVRPKQPIISPEAMAGRKCSFCDWLPYFQIGNIASEPWTEMNERSPLSPASNSRQVSP